MTILQTIWAFLATQGIDFGIKVIGAIAAWIVGRWLISLAATFMERIFERAGRIDVTVAKYLATIVSGFLTLVLILALLGIFGIQTTSFVALLAGLGLAIGTAWGGLLAHFAAGVFLQVLRPFKVGDFVTAGAITGTVREVGLFFSKIVTPDNVETILGNNTIFSGTIQNFSTLPFRRVECTAKIANGVDPRDAMERLRPAIAAIANVETNPAPDIEILNFTPEGPLLAVRPYTHTDHYWQVWFDTNRAIVDVFTAAHYPVPQTPIAYGSISSNGSAARGTPEPLPGERVAIGGHVAAPGPQDASPNSTGPAVTG
jgi:small conductance mechanosensitive channel